MTDPLLIRITDLLSTATLGVPGDPLTSTYYDDMTSTTDTPTAPTLVTHDTVYDKVYDKAWFIAFYTAIPDDQWGVGQNDDGCGHRCAYGHLTGVTSGDPGLHLSSLFGAIGSWAAVVNDGGNARYQQATPRARILAALNDLP